MVIPVLLTVLVLALLILAGCGESTPEVSEPVTSTATAQPTTTNASEIVTTTTTSTTTTTTISSPSTTTGHPRYEEVQPGETRLDNGNIAGLGYVDHLNYMGPEYRTIYVAYVEILTGEEAKAAATEDGALEPGEDLPDDYYVHKTAELPEGAVEKGRWLTPGRVLAPDASITTLTFGDGGEQEITWDQFSSFFGFGGKTPPEGGEHLANAIWYVERNETGDAVLIREYVVP